MPELREVRLFLALFTPTCSLCRVTDVTPELLWGLNVKGLLLDVDNTLAFPDSQTPFPGTVEWSRHLREAGFSLAIMSNNSAGRVRPFAAKYGLPFCPRSMKPLPWAYLHAARRLGVDRRETAVAGDQVFTDILGANLAGMKSILLLPGRKEGSFSFRVRRILEKPIRLKAGRKTERG